MTTDRKTAIITGASRGIGAAIARRLAQNGYDLLLNYAGSAQAAEALAHEARDLGVRALGMQADISAPDAAARLFDRAEEAFGGVDLLVNNAGIMQLAPIAASDDEMIARQIGINLAGSLYLMRAAAERLRNGGRIINLSSSVVGLKPESYGVYAATKAAVETLTAILAKELRGRAITVNAVAPGPTATDLFLTGKDEALVAKLAAMNPLERLGTPEDIAAVVAFLAGAEGGWINGQVLRANGGMV